MSDRDLPLFERVRAPQPGATLRDRILALTEPTRPERAAPRLAPWIFGGLLWLLLLATANAWLADPADLQTRPPQRPSPTPALDTHDLSPLQQLSLRGNGPRRRPDPLAPTAWLRLRQRPQP